MATVRRVVGHGVVVAALLAGLWGAAGRASAQTDVETVRAKVQQWLLQTLGRPGLLLNEYTYEGTTWADGSMDCPTPGQTYAQEPVNGYKWTFLFDNMVRYEVHSNFDGSTMVLCGSVNTGPTVRLTPFTSPDFTVLRPDAWLVFPSSDGQATLFAPQPRVTCDTPGMRVINLGRVAAGVTPDQLLDEYLLSINARDDLVARASVGSFGRTTRVETACDQTRRAWRVATFVEFGSAFRVEQWAPLDEFQAWDGLFSNMLGQFGTVDSVLAPATGETGTGESPAGTAPALEPLPLVHVFAGDVFTATLTDLPGTSRTSTPAFERRYLSYSPDGLHYTFMDVTNQRLYVGSSADGGSPQRMADAVSVLFPPAWSSDGSLIAYVADSGETDASGAALMTIYGTLATGGAPEVRGTFPFPADCPAPGSDPADAIYAQDSVGQDRTLVWLRSNQFLVSLGCERGLGLVTPDGLQPLLDDARGGVLSPDHTQLLTRSGEGLALLDLTTFERRDLGVGAAARQLAWAPDGVTVYYATAGLTDGLTLDNPADQARGEPFFGVWPVTANVYDLALVKLDLTTAQEAELWRGQGRGIGRIAPAPDGSGVLFTVIPSSLALVDAFQSGGDALARWAAWPTPALYWLPTGALSALLLAYSGQPVFAPITLQ